MCASRSPEPAREPRRLRARFYGEEPAGYRELNRGLTIGAGAPARPASASAAGARRSRARAGWTDLADLDRSVRIVPLPVGLEAAVPRGAIEEVEKLASDGFMSELRGGRATDLARPLAAGAAARIVSDCPNLSRILGSVERSLSGSPLFVRAVKFDRARASTTEASQDRYRENLHFDAELSSLDQYDEPVLQFYLNIGSEPRQLRIASVTLTQMTARLLSEGLVERRDVRKTALRTLLDLYRSRFSVALEVIPVESFHLAIFDGRVFAHDAGKASMPALLEGRFEPAAEDDLVLALDTVETGHHRGLYDPSVPFLEDVR